MRSNEWLQAIQEVEGEIWAEEMDKFDESDGKDLKSAEILSVIDEYNQLIHDRLKEKYGVDYQKKFA